MFRYTPPNTAKSMITRVPTAFAALLLGDMSPISMLVLVAAMFASIRTPTKTEMQLSHRSCKPIMG